MDSQKPEVLVVDRYNKVVFYGNKLIKLTRHEYRCLEYLALSECDIETKQDIYDHVYSEKEQKPKMATLDGLIGKLKQKLSEATNGNIGITNARGYGYFLRGQFTISVRDEFYDPENKYKSRLTDLANENMRLRAENRALRTFAAKKVVKNLPAPRQKTGVRRHSF